MESRRTGEGLRRRTATTVLVAAVVVYFVAVTHRTAMGVAGVEAIHRFDLAATGLAMLGVAQLVAYAGMQLPAGHLLDRFGARTMLTAGALVMAGGQLLLAFAPDVGWALAARVLVGAGDAPVFLAATRLIAQWFPPRRVPVLVQMTGLVGMAGQLASAIPVALLLHRQGWSTTFAALGALGVVSAVVAFLCVRDRAAAPEAPAAALAPDTGATRALAASDEDAEADVEPGPEEDSAAARARAPRESFVASVVAAARPAGTRLGYWCHFVTPTSANVVALLWGVPFFVSAQGRTPAEASLLLTILTATAMVAGPAVGHFTSRHPLRRSTLVLASSLLTLLVWATVLAPSTPRPLWQLVVLVVVIALGMPVALVGIDFARTSSPPARLGTATGFVNTGGFSSTILGILLVGVVLQLATPPGGEAYSLDAFRLAFASLLLPWLAGVAGVLRSRRRARIVLVESGVVVRPMRDIIRQRVTAGRD